jgi:hypothetical protein
VKFFLSFGAPPIFIKGFDPISTLVFLAVKLEAPKFADASKSLLL